MLCRLALLSLSVVACSFSCVAQMQPLSPRQGPVPTQNQVHAQDLVNALSGTVVTFDNKPLDNVRVELRSSNGGTVLSAYTNSAGDFQFPSVETGTYDVIASTGVEQVQQRIDMNGMPSTIMVRIPVNSSAQDGNGHSSVSVAEYKVPEKARAALTKARDANGKGKNDEAMRQLARALEIYPQYADALTLRAILKIKT